MMNTFQATQRAVQTEYTMIYLDRY
uniref:Uncharacterized protein n=1 Tax=Anguilla anguilla TaxID=7936 RepID=A0A0E9PHX9_ANGAN